jgi:small redox-active disulfide protein 2
MNNNQIQVYGSGCPSCKKLFELTKQAVQELGIDIEVEYSTDIQKIIDLGVMHSPVLTINGKAVMAGLTSDIEKIKELITIGTSGPDSENKSTCSFGGHC